MITRERYELEVYINHSNLREKLSICVLDSRCSRKSVAMSNNPESLETPIEAKQVDSQHVEKVAPSYELSEEEQPAMNFQTIMACIVSVPYNKIYD